MTLRTTTRRIALALGTALICAGVAVHGGISGAAAQGAKPSFAAGTTMEKLASSGKIRVGVKFDQPGLSQKNLEGKLEGFDIEIIKLIAKGLGLNESNVEWVETSSSNREPFLQQG